MYEFISWVQVLFSQNEVVGSILVVAFLWSIGIGIGIYRNSSEQKARQAKKRRD